MNDYTFIYQRPVGKYPIMYVIGIMYVRTNNVQHTIDELANRGKDVQYILNGHPEIEGNENNELEMEVEEFKF